MRGADANVRAAARATQGRARSRGPLKGPELSFCYRGLPPRAGMEENFSATEIATDALTRAVAFLVAQPELALRPGMKGKKCDVKRRAGPLCLEARGRLGGHGGPQADASGFPSESALGTASYPLPTSSSPQGRRVGKNDNTGWRLVLFKDLGDVPGEREEALAFFLTFSLVPTSPTLFCASAGLGTLTAPREDSASGKCPSSPPPVEQCR